MDYLIAWGSWFFLSPRRISTFKKLVSLSFYFLLSLISISIAYDIFLLSYIECLIGAWTNICYWRFERTIYILVFVDWYQGPCENECVDAISYILCLGSVISFACDLHWKTCLGECWCIHYCLWFAYLFLLLKKKIHS